MNPARATSQQVRVAFECSPHKTRLMCDQRYSREENGAYEFLGLECPKLAAADDVATGNGQSTLSQTSESV